MKAILIPVKRFTHAKMRLAPHFSGIDRAALASALCEDFFATIANLRDRARIFVVSAEEQALLLAQVRGWETIVETEQISESHSVDAASRHCAALGVTHLLRLPIDIPLTEPADIAEILKAAEPVVMVPSRDGTGTNALLRSPPDLFASHFGPGSFALHLEEARRLGARVRIIENPRMSVDIDELDDLHAIAGRLKPGSATQHWFSERGLVPPHE
jgi:2-phospho-L-lactate/phosphoenolpyruvate guanylyltransferase